MYDDVALVIFDCDGVLIDSEILSSKILSKELAKLGLDISFKDAIKTFVGKSFNKSSDIIKTKYNLTLNNDFESNYRNALVEVFEQKLTKIKDIDKVLKNLKVPFCLASSSSKKRILSSLKIVGLINFFEDAIFSAYGDIKKNKSSPYVYLEAARHFNVNPNKCIVIEDTNLGVLGAKRANMKVWQFLGASHIKYIQKNKDINADLIFDKMIDIFDILPENIIRKEYEKRR